MGLCSRASLRQSFAECLQQAHRASDCPSCLSLADEGLGMGEEEDESPSPRGASEQRAGTAGTAGSDDTCVVVATIIRPLNVTEIAGA